MTTVKDLIHVAQQDLRVVRATDSIARASDLLCTSRNRLIVVSDDNDKMTGVVCKGDILRGIHLKTCNFDTACESVSVKDVMACRVTDKLDDIWSQMSAKNLNAMPVVDDTNKPIGVLSSKCVLVKLLAVARDEDALMRDYISGMGYH